MIELRPHQKEALAAAQAKLLSGGARTIVNMATGTGKTVVATELIRWHIARPGGRVLFVVDRKDLARQAYEAIAGQEIADTACSLDRSCNLDARIIVSTIQSVHRWNLKGVDLIIVDECHRDTHNELYDRLYHALIGASRVGLTATPIDAKGQSILAYGKWLDICYSLDLPTAIAKGLLCNIVGRTESLEEVKLSDVEYGTECKDGTIGDAILEEEPLHKIAMLLADLPTPLLAFCPDTRTSKELVAILKRYKPDKVSVHIDCYSEDHKNGSTLRRFMRGEVDYACNCRLWGYGVNTRRCATIVLIGLRNMRSYLQELGRVTRHCCEKATETNTAECDCGMGKKFAYVLDLGGNIDQHQFCFWNLLAPESTVEQRRGMRKLQQENPDLPVTRIIHEVMRDHGMIASAKLTAVRDAPAPLFCSTGELRRRLALAGVTIATEAPAAGGRSAVRAELEPIYKQVFFAHERMASGADRWAAELSPRRAAHVRLALQRRTDAGLALPRQIALIELLGGKCQGNTLTASDAEKQIASLQGKLTRQSPRKRNC